MKSHQFASPYKACRCASLSKAYGQAALEAVLLTLLLVLAVFSMVDDSPLARLVMSLTDHHARLTRGLSLP